MSILSKIVGLLRPPPSSQGDGGLSPAELACLAHIPLSRVGRNHSMASLFDGSARSASGGAGGLPGPGDPGDPDPA